MATRVGFALSQGVQNPVAYSLLPEFFPNHRTTAMAVYNTAIYLGRALAFVCAILAGQAATGQVRGAVESALARSAAGHLATCCTSEAEQPGALGKLRPVYASTRREYPLARILLRTISSKGAG
jgi:MFS family permease